MSRHVDFYNKIKEVISNNNKNFIKASVGNSINNNRTVLVSQFRRFLVNSDNIDINEFIYFYENMVLGSGELKDLTLTILN